MNKNRGFTLVELLIVVVIIGILSTIAYPSYREYVLRSNRTEGQAFLNEAAARQERYFTQNNTYALTTVELGLAALADSQSGLYRLSINRPSPTEYTLTVQPINSQVGDTGCGNLTLNQAGVRGKSGSKPLNECWR